MKTVLRLMRHEGWSDEVDIFDRNAVCNDPSDPWSANCSIQKQLFFVKNGRGGYSRKSFLSLGLSGKREMSAFFSCCQVVL